MKSSDGRRRLVTLEDAVRAVVECHGGVRAAERATGVDKSFISRLMNGHKVAPSAETLEALGLRAVPLYEVLKRPNDRLGVGDRCNRRFR
jgi:transcriptional regulator with XRE-family HTH domain